MGNPSNNQHYSLLVAHWNDLMAIRKFITDNKHNPANIHADVAKVFDPEAYDAIRSLSRLSNLRKKTRGTSQTPPTVPKLALTARSRTLKRQSRSRQSQESLRGHE